MIAFLNRRTAASSSSGESGPWRTNWSRISSGTGASGVSGVRLFRLRRIGSPHAMPHTRNFGYPPEAGREAQQVREFASRTERHVEETEIVAFRKASAPLDDVGRHRNSGPTNLTL